MRVAFWGVLVALFVVACSGDSGESAKDVVAHDSAEDKQSQDVGMDTVGDVADDLGVDANSEDVPGDLADQVGDTTVVQGKATAFVAASEEDLIKGPVSAGVVGDVVIRNDLVRFVIRNQEKSLYSPYGGALVDADLVRAPGEEAQDHFFEMFPMTGTARIFKPTEMSIVDDGSESGTAIVRFKGNDGGMALVDSALPTPPLGIEVTVDYILEPGVHHLKIITKIHNPKTTPRSVDVGQFLQFSSRTTPFYDDCGPVSECPLTSSNVGWLATAAGSVSYGATVPKGKNAKLLLSFDKLTVVSGGNFSIPAGGDAESLQYFIVGEGTIEDVRAKARAIRGESAGEKVVVKVTLGDEHTNMADVGISVKKAGQEDARGWITAATPDQNGEALLHLEEGSYDFHLNLPGAPELVVKGTAVKAGEENVVELAANPAGWIRVKVTDDADAPVHAALTLQGGKDAAWTAGVTKYAAVLNGERLIPVLAGDYTATVARGLVWSIDRQNITVTAGQVTDLTAKIHEAVDTTGFIMLNSHEHSEWSIDSAVLEEDRIANALANGIEVMTPTDHDYFGTRQPKIEEMGLAGDIKASLGCEVSPLWGHTTAAHCSNPPPYETYFAVEYMLYDENGKSIRATTATEIYTQAREELGCAFLAVNHPYRGGATFSTYGVTATSNPADAEPKLNLHLVDALEVVNKDDSFDSILTENLPAWYNLLNRGYSIAAIGGSDEHHYRGNYGNPRNMVASSTDVPGDVDLDEVYDNIKKYKSVVLAGPVLRLTVDGKGLGETVVAAGASVEVNVVVEAPEWMGLEFVRVVMNGEVIKEFVPVASGAVARLDETFTAELQSDAWIVFMAGSSLPEHEMEPVSSKQPFSITNPVFIDADGNGYEAIHASGAPWDDQ